MSNNKKMPELQENSTTDLYKLGFQKPFQFYPKNREQYDDWGNVKIVILHERDQKDKSQCQKNNLYPKFPDPPEFCQEEVLAYKWFSSKNIENTFTKRCHEFMKQGQKDGTGSLEESPSKVEKKQEKRKKSSQNDAGPSKKSKQKDKSHLMPIMEYHNNENVPFAKPKSPTVVRNSSGKLTQMRNLPLSSIENVSKELRPGRKSSVANILNSDEEMESLSIHKGPHIGQHRNRISSSSSDLSEFDENEIVSSTPTVSSSIPQLKEFFNPFDINFVNHLIEKAGVVDQLKRLETCSFVKKAKNLTKGQSVHLGEEEFCVVKSLTKGGYGTIFSAKSKRTEEIFALKQEKPPNIWEYYLCLELQKRIQNPEILPYFISISHALIGENLSILAMPFSRFGSLIDVNNLVLAATNHYIDELIVFLITKQLLSIINFLHEAQIIHADLKPDNFLVISEINSAQNPKPFIQLIDFGCAIDVKLVKQQFPNFNGFHGSLKKNPCIEMQEGRRWIYQLDWYGIAGTIHAILFSEYMKVIRDDKNGKWKIRMAIKRYFRHEIWENLFEKLLNVPKNTEPDLKNIMEMIDQEITKKNNVVVQKVNEFNKILNGKK